ncbi:hypothetical protein KY284_035826 [Solanum tuberosum]|nr:hypothetical protein KY284_035826 [Solanum tuberosum]
MANHFVAYSDDESSSESTGSRSMLTSPNAQSQGEENHSTDPSITSLPHDSIPIDPVPVYSQSPLPTYASGEPFTSSLSSLLSETPNPNRHFSPPLSPIETPISTTATTSPPSLPSHPLEHDLDDVPLSAQLQEGATSRAKFRRLGKSPVPPSSSPVILDSESDDISTSNPSGAHFQSKKANVVKRVCELLNFQGWGNLFLDTELLVHEKEVVEFYTNLKVLEENVVTSTVKGMNSVSSQPNIPNEGLPPRLGRGHRRHISSFRDMGIANALERKEPVDWPSLMIKHMARVADPQPGSHQLAFGNLLTRVFTAFVVPLGEG